MGFLDSRWLKEIRSEYTQRFVNPSGFEVIHEDEPSPDVYEGELIFVDGVLRNFLTAWREALPIVVSQVVVGAISKKPGGEPEIDVDPVSELIIAIGGIPASETPDRLKIGGLEFRVLTSESPDPFETIRTRMETLEMRLARELAIERKAVVIKDGTLRPIYEAYSTPVLIEDRGPVGYVKNLEDTYGFSEFFRNLLDIKRGERTKAFYKAVGKLGYQVSTFLKLSEGEEFGFARLDVFVDDIDRKSEALKLFDLLSKTLAEMSIPIKIGRYPENLPIVENLEIFLRAHLLDPRYVEYELRRSLKI